MKTKVPREVTATPIVSPAEIAKMIPIPPPSPDVIEMLDKMEKMRANAGMPLPPASSPSELRALYAKPASAPLVDAVSMSAVTATQAEIQAANAPEQPVVTIAVITVGQVIEWKKGKCAGALGHVVSVEPDGVICVQQPCDLPALKWFKVPTGEFKIIGRAAGIYKIPASEIAKHSEKLKPKPKKMEQFDAPQ